MFSAVPNTSNYYMEAIYVSSVDTVTSGIFTISATSAEETPRSASNQILFKVSKPLGDFEVEGELKYDDQTRVVTGTWSASENAEGYVLMYQAGSSNTFASLGELKTTNKDGKLEGTLTLPSGLSGTVRIAVAAVNGQVCLTDSGICRFISLKYPLRTWGILYGNFRHRSGICEILNHA